MTAFDLAVFRGIFMVDLPFGKTSYSWFDLIEFVAELFILELDFSLFAVSAWVASSE